MRTEEEKSKAAEETAAEMEERQEVRRQKEQSQWQDLNQGIQTGTHDTQYTGPRWGSSYKIRRKKSKSGQSGEEKKG